MAEETSNTKAVFVKAWCHQCTLSAALAMKRDCKHGALDIALPATNLQGLVCQHGMDLAVNLNLIAMFAFKTSYAELVC